MELTSEHLVLKPVSRADAPILHAMWTSAGGRRYLWDDEIIPASQTAEIIERSEALFMNSGFGLWLARQRDNDQAVGYGGYWYFRTPPELELLYGVDEAYWNLGYATEIGRMLLDYGFNRLKFNAVTASTDVANQASVHVMQKLKMSFKAQLSVGGLETIYYEIQRDDWLVP
ncbi:MAG TPA: GNAT family protein [Blastocatellia bacterium]|nr:GNAT family protein [Blastocatellia bacterium]